MNTAQAKTDDVPTKEKLLSLVDDIELISKVRKLVCIRIALLFCIRNVRVQYIVRLFNTDHR